MTTLALKTAKAAAPAKQRTSRTGSRVLLWIVLVAASATVLVPFLAIVAASLQDPSSLTVSLAWPDKLHFENYANAWSTAGFSSLLASSALIALVVVPVALVCASLAGYAFATVPFRGKNWLMGLLLLGMALPYEAIIIPLYFGMKGAGLLDTQLAVILPLVGAFMPFGILWMRSHFEQLPDELSEAAEMDGASTPRTMLSVLLPVSWAPLTTLGLLYFMWAWNQFLLALIMLQDPAKRTAPSGLGKFVQQFGTNIPMLAAGTVIIIVPVVVIYLVFQRHFIRGMISGAVKG
ncbi:carbohydrate ABC transporter permease [Pseudarthrobacter sp. J75]|uniref:carbohydrate ABC transporter permease n=1 Tax=unclassified Pseudarthrobacter TaxID=2647000 RepID=UPI002E813A47|nr:MULTISPECIES: carbohydrate ABC transporter permease [unclassified Pseudarthrobacter]MEE2524182.1 carbohydrate ABC transporter permease [Pseudarthrobacter sp. J47]MEE2530220.1 carbohydrate ABC transporter permease [Pseudarthrobacter sp. J75]